MADPDPITAAGVLHGEVDRDLALVGQEDESEHLLEVGVAPGQVVEVAAATVRRVGQHHDISRVDVDPADGDVVDLVGGVGSASNQQGGSKDGGLNEVLHGMVPFGSVEEQLEQIVIVFRR